ncbi:MAG: ATP-binding protein, partial [Bdellovibrionota bacterium]|nr:ATP-binding protein [Bdellovibrionota bacterium]
YDFMQENNIQRDTIINARDAHGELIKPLTMQKGHYPLKSLEKIPERYHKYLNIKKDELSLKHEVTSKVIFSPGNLITGTRLFGMDIVLCQNILPALKRSFQIEILQKMTTAVRPKGFLITEGDTVLPEEVEENFKKTGEVDNRFFELVKRGEVGKYLGQAEAGRESDGVGMRAEEVRKRIQSFADRRSEELPKKTLDQEKETLYLDEIDKLQKELALTKTSLEASTMSFEKTYNAQVKSAEELKRANHELTNIKENLIKMIEGKTRELVKSNEALEKMQKRRSLFFAKLSHELRTPLNAIMGFSNILLQKNKSEEDENFLNSINSSGKSLLNLVNSIHDFTVIDLDEFSVVKKKMPLSKLLKDLTTYYTNECVKKGIMFFLDLPENFPKWIVSDEYRLKQVFDNILGNSIKFTKSGHVGVIAKTRFHENKSKVDLIFKIEDSGKGIESTKINDLFKTFSQVHEPGSIKEKGTGLGLYITKQIVEKLGGEIDVISQTGKGSIFTVTIKNVPVVEGNEEVVIGPSYRFFGDLILIADEEPMNLALFKAYFSSYDLVIETAKNNEELVSKSKKLMPSLIIVDSKLAFTSEGKELEGWGEVNKKVPKILISTYKLEGKKFDGFLQEPIEQEIFVNEVSKFLKHEKIKNENRFKKINKEKFYLPEDLGPLELEIIDNLKAFMQRGNENKEINYIEEKAEEFSQSVEKTKLSNLKPWLIELKESASLFDMDQIEEKLVEGLHEIGAYERKDKAS